MSRNSVGLSATSSSSSPSQLSLPSYRITRAAAPDLTLIFDPPIGSQELADALSYHYPFHKDLQQKLQQASLDFFLSEKELESTSNSSILPTDIAQSLLIPFAAQLVPTPSHATRYNQSQSSKLPVASQPLRPQLTPSTSVRNTIWDSRTGTTAIKKHRGGRTKGLEAGEKDRVAKNRGNACERHRMTRTKCLQETCADNRLNACGYHRRSELKCTSICPNNLLNTRKEEYLPAVESSLQPNNPPDAQQGPQQLEQLMQTQYPYQSETPQPQQNQLSSQPKDFQIASDLHQLSSGVLEQSEQFPEVLEPSSSGHELVYNMDYSWNDLNSFHDWDNNFDHYNFEAMPWDTGSSSNLISPLLATSRAVEIRGLEGPRVTSALLDPQASLNFMSPPALRPSYINCDATSGIYETALQADYAHRTVRELLTGADVGGFDQRRHMPGVEASEVLREQQSNGHPSPYLNMAAGPSSSAPILITLLGKPGTGKSSLIKFICGHDLEVNSVKHGIESCTQDMRAVPCRIGTQDILLADTPGFNDTNLGDTEILTRIADLLKDTYDRGNLLSGIVYLHRISDPRKDGASTTNLRMFRKLCGSKNLDNVVLSTTFWNKFSVDEGQEREERPEIENSAGWVGFGEGIPSWVPSWAPDHCSPSFRICNSPGIDILLGDSFLGDGFQSNRGRYDQHASSKIRGFEVVREEDMSTKDINPGDHSCIYGRKTSKEIPSALRSTTLRWEGNVEIQDPSHVSYAMSSNVKSNVQIKNIGGVARLWMQQMVLFVLTLKYTSALADYYVTRDLRTFCRSKHCLIG